MVCVFWGDNGDVGSFGGLNVARFFFLSFFLYAVLCSWWKSKVTRYFEIGNPLKLGE